MALFGVLRDIHRPCTAWSWLDSCPLSIACSTGHRENTEDIHKTDSQNTPMPSKGSSSSTLPFQTQSRRSERHKVSENDEYSSCGFKLVVDLEYSDRVVHQLIEDREEWIWTLLS